MDPVVMGALIGFGGSAVISVATQIIAGSRERARLTQQLSHERNMRIQDDVECLIDELYAAMRDSERAIREFTLSMEHSTTWYRLGEARAPGDRARYATQIAELGKNLNEAVLRMHDSAHRLDSGADRLEVRLGSDHELTIAARSVRHTLLEVGYLKADVSLANVPEEVFSAGELEAVLEATVDEDAERRLRHSESKLRERVVQFTEAAHRWHSRA